MNIMTCLSSVWEFIGTNGVIIAIITAVATHLFETRKLKKEQKIQYENGIGEKTAMALLSVREVELKLTEIEAYKPLFDIESGQSRFFEENVFYPAIMTTRDTLSDFFDKICDARQKYEPLLSLKSAANLFAMERYIADMLIYLKVVGMQDHPAEVGLLVIADLNKWQKRFDEVLVSEINRPKYKFFSKSGKRWENQKKKAIKSLRQNCVLDDLRSKAAEYLEYALSDQGEEIDTQV